MGRAFIIGANKLLSLVVGDIYAIPLFLSSEPDDKSFTRYKFGQDDESFIFCRVIDDLKGSGILIEIFNYVSVLQIDIGKVINSPLIFPALPIVGNGISKKRWRRVGVKRIVNMTK